MYQFLSLNVKERLHEISMIPQVRLEEPVKEAPEKIKAPEPFESNRIANLIKENTEYKAEAAPAREQIPTSRVFGVPGKESNVIKADQHIMVERPVQLNLFEEQILTKEAREEYRILGQVFDTYWLIAYQDKLLIIDQHAAHEKVKYERLLMQLKEKSVTSQLLTPPMMLSLTGQEKELLLEYMSYFTDLGFEIEEFGTDTYAVRSMPTDLYGCDEKEFFVELLDELAENPMKGTPDVILSKLASMSCKAAVKGNSRMEAAEMEALIDELLMLENPYHCPHGRPTIISMSKYELEKKFKRIV